MKILVSDAVSDVAYHVIPMLASGDVIYDQPIELILCDRVSANNELEGLMYEMQDCAFSAVSGISITNNFTESCKTADVIIMLPNNIRHQNHHSFIDVNIFHSSLTQIDFQCLNNIMCPVILPKNDARSEQCHGPLSTANAICQYIKHLYIKNIKEMQREQEIRREEAEFGCPPDPSYMSLLSDSNQWPRAFYVHSRTMFISVIASDIPEELHYKQLKDDFTRVFARL
ncbi:hypothetical protein ACF0H5_002926 [Mactra antiquata]